MADFSFVTARLATGAAVSSPDDVTALTDAGVTHVIDCRAEFDDGPLFAGVPGVQYLWNPTPDDGQHPKPLEWFTGSLEFALPALIQPRARVYAHCAAGVNRGPSTAYAIMRALGWTASAARAAITAARPQAQIAYADDADRAIAMLGYG
jgi:dual specificity phosphatase 3